MGYSMSYILNIRVKRYNNSKRMTDQVVRKSPNSGYGLEILISELESKRSFESVLEKIKKYGSNYMLEEGQSWQMASVSDAIKSKLTDNSSSALMSPISAVGGTTSKSDILIVVLPIARTL